ncbi:MAG: hypothetical protein COV08_03300 [Candidatus Vogelbacteria bacterium CG10_big_fil_rev_8_21_14_0_10_49_38]|uniref:Uncharacterized protein n=1 Tax=Candidatus Vogelbacteria bacterium CG10_big_fil_rev_8_21_14_0_10_49_38 TaxID=1975043 RepID=A0A2H0RGT5_9BACT|nr:MAG: hypothetical protein BK006_03300 [bacterium CG10_49_38]PIR45771.1 MAG: hypothetical protein COV08_03300 [Candidatus Vogelbacteria bacterium CG10_big_fil_rev_8_21_14_0_10_49_38]
MQLLDNIKEQIINPVIMLLFGLALLYFLWGLVQFLAKNNSAVVDKKELRDKMIYGLIGMTIMASVFGIMHVITNTIVSLMGQ